MTKAQLHLMNFYQLVEEAGSLTVSVRKCGYDNSASLSQLKRRLETQMEDESARGVRPSLVTKLKAGMGKRKDWLNRDHNRDKEKAAIRMTTEAAENFIMPSEIVISTEGRFVIVIRNTRETQIILSLDLGNTGQDHLDTDVPFLNHMLDQTACHDMINLEITCRDDAYVDDHHIVEDIGIVFGQTPKQALGDKAGIRCYGHAYVPLDESLSRVVLDSSGRPRLIYNVDFVRAWMGRFDMGLFSEFLRSIVSHNIMMLHIDNLRGNNAHHQAEIVFKALGRTLREAVKPNTRLAGGTSSTKDALTD